MSLTFGKTKADNFGRIFEGNPRLLTRNSYLNFLRYYKSKHPRYGLARMLQRGLEAWTQLPASEQAMFKQKVTTQEIQ